MLTGAGLRRRGPRWDLLASQTLPRAARRLMPPSQEGQDRPRVGWHQPSARQSVSVASAFQSGRLPPSREQLKEVVETLERHQRMHLDMSTMSRLVEQRTPRFMDHPFIEPDHMSPPPLRRAVKPRLHVRAAPGLAPRGQEEEGSSRRMWGEEVAGVSSPLISPQEALDAPFDDMDRQYHEQLEQEEAMARLEAVEEELESSTYKEAIEGFQEVQATLFKTGKAASLPPVQRAMLSWYEPVTLATDQLVTRLSKGQWQNMPGAGTFGPFLRLLTPDTLAVLALHTTVNAIMKEGPQGVPLARLLVQIGTAVQLEVDCLRLEAKFGKRVVKGLQKNGLIDVKRVNRRARQALEDGIWTTDLKAQVGGVLLKAVVDAAKTEGGEAAFTQTVEGMGGKKRRNMILMERGLFDKMAGDEQSLPRLLVPRYRPMVVPPNDWRSYDSGGYRNLKTCVVRATGGRGQVEALKSTVMPRVYEALNYLGQVKWAINHDVHEVVKAAWKAGLTIGQLPSQKDLPLPEEQGGEGEDAQREYRQAVRRIQKHNAELYSLRCDTVIKLEMAEQFAQHKEFYFPYNLDFRGRAYPVPPNLNHLGSDFCRSMLSFAEKRPLGERGLWWLKVHLANLCGQDKLSFDGRVEFIDQNMDKVMDSAARPLDGECWWQKAEEPWQALAVCMEVAKAVQSGHPETFLSGLAVHQDGSCNGLQHYAALGRDVDGAMQVNLIASEKPQDVYSGVCELVIKHVHDEASRPEEELVTDEEKKRHRLAKLVDGLIGRKVVKQTVMTSVYGVTYIGAKKQIQARLREKFMEQHGRNMLTEQEEQDAYDAAAYVATVTLSSLGELFSSANQIMQWLATCASLVSKQGQPMAWVTPLGLPVIQPYRRETGVQVKTLMQNVVLVDCNDKLPVSSSRQRSAFPPNFVHSLDSTHMLMTTNKLKVTGIPFTAVHDSYWCHAGHVDLMNQKLRESFVELYHQPILEDLRASLVRRFPEVDFPPIPERGQLRLEDVLDSPYFFD